MLTFGGMLKKNISFACPYVNYSSWSIRLPETCVAAAMLVVSSAILWHFVKPQCVVRILLLHGCSCRRKIKKGLHLNDYVTADTSEQQLSIIWLVAVIKLCFSGYATCHKMGSPTQLFHVVWYFIKCNKLKDKLKLAFKSI